MKKSRLSAYVLTLLLSVLFFFGLTLWQGSYILERLMGPLTVEQVLFHLWTPIAGISDSLHQLQWSVVRSRACYALMFWFWCSGCLTSLAQRGRLWRWLLALALLAFQARLLMTFRLYPDSLVIWLAVLLLSLGDLLGAGSRLPERLWHWLQHEGGRRYLALLLVMVTLLGMTTRWQLRHGLWDYLGNRFHPSTMLDEQYVDPADADYALAAEPRNLVLIVSESLENTYADPTLFGTSLIPELQAWQQRHEGFRGQIEVNGTDNTISSITAMLYGMPRLLVGREGWHNQVSGNMFSGSTSILHVLKQFGYRFAHIQGGSTQFADTASLYEDFPDTEIVEFAQLSSDEEYQRLLADKRHYDWGVHDRIMLKHARHLYSRLQRDARPFVLVISTIDTHYDGYLESERPRKPEDVDYRDCVREQSRLLGEFASWLAEQPGAERTVTAIIGDHYVMRNFVGDTRMWLLTNGTKVQTPPGQPPQRTVFSSLANDAPPEPPPAQRQRLFASFDWAPTLLEAVGVRWTSRRFGVGVSLYAPEPTLLERLGGETYERESRRVSETYRRLIDRAQAAHRRD